MSKPLCYFDQSSYKYVVADEEFLVQTDIRPPAGISTSFVDLDAAGRLVAKVGYAWDGPSGPAIDSPKYMRASLVHDALYQLMRLRKLDPTPGNRRAADRLFLRHLKEDSMFFLRRGLAYLAVRIAGKSRIEPGKGPHKTKVCVRKGVATIVS